MTRDGKIKMYDQDDALVEQWQCRDPALTNITDLIMKMLSPLRGRALDVGCGTGRVTIRLAEQGFEVDALDVEEKVIDIARRVAARRNLTINFSVCDFVAQGDSFADATYDVVVCTEVLEHLENWRPVVRIMCRVLKPGGTLVITVPHNPQLYSVIDEHVGHYRRYRVADLAPLFDGYEVTTFTTGFPFVRLVTWSYITMLKLTGRRHAPEKLWQKGSAYRNFGSKIMYGLDKVDNLFNGLHQGMTLVVRAVKPVQERQL
jgi:SAM-dependent methyltransferase